MEEEATIAKARNEGARIYLIGTLVEFEVDHSEDSGSFIKGTVRAYVCYHNRDCDGSPLYDMCMWNPKSWNGISERFSPENYTSLRRHAKMFDPQLGPLSRTR